MNLQLFWYISLVWILVNSDEITRPNIVFIVADDLGWDDVSFHGSDQIMTPNIDTLAYSGVILDQYYTDTLGTPSRSALFTGKYPLRLGMQSISIKASEDRGIPTPERLLPAYLQELGYQTNLIGKWHVGKSREHYLPTYRGFDTFYGFLGGSVDYLTYNLIETFNHTSFYGLDFFDGLKPVEDLNGYLTDILTDKAVEVIRDHNTSSPLYLHVSHAAAHVGGALVNLQAPLDTVAANDHIAHSARRLYAGMVSTLDKSVGHIVAALAEREILKNTIIVFVSDNGAPTTGLSQNYGSNFPLRGAKNTPWEGGARSPAVLWSPSLNSGIWHGLFHVTDWLPTLVAAAGGNVNETIDGVNQWEAITKGEQPKRNDILITIDDIGGWAALREGDFKLIVGDLKDDSGDYHGAELRALRHEVPIYEHVLLESETFRVIKETLKMDFNMEDAFAKRNRSNLLTKTIPLQDAVACVPTKAKGCLFNITDDPLEAHDLWKSSPEIVKRMALRLRSMWAGLKPRWSPQYDARANPALHDYIWRPWVDNDDVFVEPPTVIPPFPLQVTIGELEYLVDLNLNSFRQKMFDSIKNMGRSFVRSIGGLFT
ncbi:arylsulfatase B-like [Pectinophora gossypiella]|uniref:arylsulfatase B-like n=1 Tax=Pectinophora gossypiella TaxID=13191 RepID=UPI00214ED5F1|nr:arylsulfatase B-like [Pectinophora gossypiella]